MPPFSKTRPGYELIIFSDSITATRFLGKKRPSSRAVERERGAPGHTGSAGTDGCLPSQRRQRRPTSQSEHAKATSRQERQRRRTPHGRICASSSHTLLNSGGGPTYSAEEQTFEAFSGLAEKREESREAERSLRSQEQAQGGREQE